MQTLERNNSVKYTVNISQEMGEPQAASLFLSDTLQAIFTLVEKRGIKLSPSSGINMTPEFLEKLLLNKEKTEKKQVFSQNKSMNDFLTEVNSTGGIDKETADHIRSSSREFREDFEFKHDQ